MSSSKNLKREPPKTPTRPPSPTRSTSSTSPATTITVSSEDWLGMLNGSLNPMQAFMSGKIKIDGDMTLAMSLQQVMNLAQD
ncbi:MAG: SCP2 sterol-binding domain-containing protein [Deltaproteobacteria bacterium]|nr:SCP2 sterol-binding domain-containing protein [Deltaproteobacteria bacterium]